MVLDKAIRTGSPQTPCAGGGGQGPGRVLPPPATRQWEIQTSHLTLGQGLGIWDCGKQENVSLTLKGSPRLPVALRCPVEMPSVARSFHILPPKRQKRGIFPSLLNPNHVIADNFYWWMDIFCFHCIYFLRYLCSKRFQFCIFVVI